MALKRLLAGPLATRKTPVSKDRLQRSHYFIFAKRVDDPLNRLRITLLHELN